MAKDVRDELLRQLSAEVDAAHEVASALDEAVAARLGVNRTDLRCLRLLHPRAEPAAPSQLGVSLGLTTGGVTAMLDRLEKQGYVTRAPDPVDRRKVIIRRTGAATAAIEALYGPIVEADNREADRYADAELEVIVDFLCRGRRLREEHWGRVRGMSGVLGNGQPAARRDLSARPTRR